MTLQHGVHTLCRSIVYEPLLSRAAHRTASNTDPNTKVTCVRSRLKNSRSSSRAHWRHSWFLYNSRRLRSICQTLSRKREGQARESPTYRQSVSRCLAGMAPQSHKWNSWGFDRCTSHQGGRLSNRTATNRRTARISIYWWTFEQMSLSFSVLVCTNRWPWSYRKSTKSIKGKRSTSTVMATHNHMWTWQIWYWG